MTDTPAARPWYREPWPWILMAGPLVAIIGCVITIYLAMTRYGDQPIAEGAVKRGLVVERVAAPAATPADARR
ncbi:MULTISPECIES: FixH family protein [Bordetella]|uniref:Lipoprotein n=1 Tax=Bordetella genomosp. 6 TaxID=463024 RepID=A0ABX4FHA1_9BORD|nr:MULTISPECIES: FixH family protein [Bordetella]AOB26378.1 lipoprotein [Bordetella bronchiseptica]ARP76051.1 lipoprotein [Bordetella genomosp. 6]AZW43679.1 lipoprotein [Bordetella bronchiseptica]KCV65804.1 FixH domain protein [Bordetella bronchiseptica 99-R-0433]MBN3269106.1 lipoprotein [Bordetella bronchiseptica]